MWLIYYLCIQCKHYFRLKQIWLKFNSTGILKIKGKEVSLLLDLIVLSTNLLVVYRESVNLIGSITRRLSAVSINLLVVYHESLNLIGYITPRLSADSLQLWIANEIGYFEHVMPVSHLSAHHAQCLKPLNCRCKHNKTFFHKRYFTFLCTENTSKFILKQLDYSPSFSTSDSQLGCPSLTICS